jgi:hypothetical protein
MATKYSKNFERDYTFYLNNLDNFDFCGTQNPKFEADFDYNGKSAKDVFYSIQSHGKNLPCSEPELLNKLLICQSGINFQIKQWAEARAEGLLPLPELSKREWRICNPKQLCPDLKTLCWENKEPVYYDDIETQYGLPAWVIDAVERQKYKFYKPIAA